MSNRPSCTAHLYEKSEIDSMHEIGILKGNVKDAVMAVIERDLSKNGNAAFSDNFSAVLNFIGVASPASLLMVLSRYEAWMGRMHSEFSGSTGQSYTDKAARKILLDCTVDLCQRSKSLLLPDASVVSLSNSVLNIAKMDPSRYQYDDLKETISWVDELGPATGITCKNNVGLDAHKIVHAFCILLQSANNFWNKVSLKEANLEKQRLDPEDPTIDHDAINDPDAGEKKVRVIETNLLSAAQLIYAIDSFEKRKVPKKGQPPFVKSALALFPLWKEQLSKIRGRADKLFSRPLAWMFGPLFKMVSSSFPKPGNATVVLLGLLEMLGREVCNDRDIWLTAVIFTSRCRALDWKSQKSKVDFLSLPEVEPLIGLYDSVPPATKNNTDIQNPEKLADRRVFSVPEIYINCTTFRGKGKDTSENLVKGAKDIEVDIGNWSDEEKLKSHGPGREGFARKMSECDEEGGQLTYMKYYLEVSRVPESEAVVNPYHQDAKDLLLKCEEEFGHEKCNPKDISARLYPTWVSSFPCDLPERTEDPEEKGKKKKVREIDPSESTSGTGASKKKKSTASSLASSKTSSSASSESASKEKSTKKHSQGQNVILVQKKNEGELMPELREGALIRIKKIIFESVDIPSDEDTQKYTKKRVAMQLDGESEQESSKPKKSTKKKQSTASSSTKEEEELDDDNEQESMEVEKPQKSKSNKRPASEEGEPKAKKAKKAKPVDESKLDLLEVSEYREITEDERERLNDAPLLKKPIGNAKRFVRDMGDFVFKGPYLLSAQKDVENVKKQIYRTLVMNTLWEDTITAGFNLVHDPENNVVYLESKNLRTSSLDNNTTKTTLKTHQCQTVMLVNPDSTDVKDLGKLVQKGSVKEYESYLSVALKNLAARYLIGSGGGHLGEIILNSQGLIAAIDLEDNRESVPVFADSPELLDLLFVNKKAPPPSLKDFYRLLPTTFPDLWELVKTAKCVKPEEIKDIADALKIAVSPPPPTLQKRLETLENCLKQSETLVEKLKNNDSGIPEMPDEEDQ